MIQVIQHVTTAGERWDTLAWKYYNNASLFAPILAANPTVPAMGAFDPGLVINVPILLIDASVTQTANLPPWRR